LLLRAGRGVLRAPHADCSASSFAAAWRAVRMTGALQKLIAMPDSSTDARTRHLTVAAELKRENERPRRRRPLAQQHPVSSPGGFIM
jgi:hypothetical protein